MDVRAAVAFGPGKPLEVTNVKLDGPRAGEVLVEIKATGNLSHRRVHVVGRRPGGTLSRNPRTRGRPALSLKSAPA